VRKKELGYVIQQERFNSTESFRERSNDDGSPGFTNYAMPKVIPAVVGVISLLWAAKPDKTNAPFFFNLFVGERAERIEECSISAFAIRHRSDTRVAPRCQ
jgi:hypothetical protein